MAPIPLSNSPSATIPALPEPIPVNANHTSQTPSKKRKRKDEKPHILHQSTFRRQTWTYLHLTLITPSLTTSTTKPTTTTAITSTPPTLDPLTISPLLTQPLAQYLGTTGAATPIDILKTAGRDVWIRVPRQDARALRASLSTWVGSCDAESVPGVGLEEEGRRVRVAWRVVGESGVMRGEGDEDGRGLFDGLNWI
ncbi:hypothetical protein FB567DRAFT_627035 [Paraphoma chrysanthemicola]|uniref:Ribonucleases P/MRP subunit Pop8-like domain-containing protein n=1 Tax=Paraphoma chrysanthemicola TaxID=798071 RepID=A0A8K0VZZ7_9PLEO|nr:hypothetical protein FB567DRAFT_627035 [Paraphoma chrysanthemicola]